MLNDDDIRALKPGDHIYSCRGNHASLPVHSTTLGSKGGWAVTVCCRTARGKLMTLTRKNFRYWAPTRVRACMEYVPPYL